MAQASSAQREPSMEEILASIRRIIEDNESGRREDDSFARRTSSPEAGEVETFRAELKPLSSAKSSEEKEGDAFKRPERVDVPAQHHTDSAPFSDAFDMMADDDEEDFSIPVAANTAAPEGAGRQFPQAEPSENRAEPVDSERRAILSEAPERKVAAAFGELNEALLANRRKTLDQMAEEMLRPMLQDWLDNNLPQLVEKLVREEIERIARGG